MRRRAHPFAKNAKGWGTLGEFTFQFQNKIEDGALAPRKLSSRSSGVKIPTLNIAKGRDVWYGPPLGS